MRALPLLSRGGCAQCVGLSWCGACAVGRYTVIHRRVPSKIAGIGTVPWWKRLFQRQRRRNPVPPGDHHAADMPHFRHSPTFPEESRRPTLDRPRQVA